MANHSQMVDKNGTPVKAGDRCKFWVTTRRGWAVGTVRKVRTHSYYQAFENREDVWEALVDDGETSNPDLSENGFGVTAWVESSAIEVTND